MVRRSRVSNGFARLNENGRFGGRFHFQAYNLLMSIFSEKIYHRLFRWGIWLKILLSFGEIAAGVALSFLTYETIKRFVFFFIGGELAETPRDFFWEHMASWSRSFTAAPESFWAFLLISHGIVKLFLAWGLWKEKLWAFPAGAAVFIGFVVYQIYQLTYLNSVFLWLITIFDIVLIVLVLQEWRRLKHVQIPHKLF